MNINDYNRLYRQRVRSASGGASAFRLQLETVGPKTIRVLTHVTVENKTTAFTKLRLGITNTGRNYYLDEIQTIAAAELITSRSDIILGEADILFAELTGTTNGDVVILTALGWEQRL